MSVSSRAEGEASQKGLSGAAKRQYVGGAINRARHERAQGKADHREAIADARSQIRYHEAQIAGLREGVKLRQGLAATGKPKRGASNRDLTKRILESDLKPIRHVESVDIDLSRPVDPAFLREVYGQSQLTKALELYPTERLREGARYQGVSASGSREALIARLAAPPTPRAAPVTRPLAQPKSKRAPRPKKPPTLAQQIDAAGGYVPKTPAEKLRALPVREMTDTQLMRDWENHPPERRRGVLEREMARRQAKAEKAQQPKPAKAKRGADVGKLRERERELMARDAALEREQSDLLERANDEPDVSRGHAAATRAIYHIGPEREKVNRQLKAIRTRLRNAGG